MQSSWVVTAGEALLIRFMKKIRTPISRMMGRKLRMTPVMLMVPI